MITHFPRIFKNHIPCVPLSLSRNNFLFFRAMNEVGRGTSGLQRKLPTSGHASLFAYTAQYTSVEECQDIRESIGKCRLY
jgi:hypothetical protein